MLTVLALCSVIAPQSPSQGYPEQDAQTYSLRLFVDVEAKRIEARVRYEFLARTSLEVIKLDSTPSDKWTRRYRSTDGRSQITSFSRHLSPTLPGCRYSGTREDP